MTAYAIHHLKTWISEIAQWTLPSLKSAHVCATRLLCYLSVVQMKFANRHTHTNATAWQAICNGRQWKKSDIIQPLCQSLYIVNWNLLAHTIRIAILFVFVFCVANCPSRWVWCVSKWFCLLACVWRRSVASTACVCVWFFRCVLLLMPFTTQRNKSNYCNGFCSL